MYFRGFKPVVVPSTTKPIHHIKWTLTITFEESRKKEWKQKYGKYADIAPAFQPGSTPHIQCNHLIARNMSRIHYCGMQQCCSGISKTLSPQISWFHQWHEGQQHAWCHHFPPSPLPDDKENRWISKAKQMLATSRGKLWRLGGLKHRFLSCNNYTSFSAWWLVKVHENISITNGRIQLYNISEPQIEEKTENAPNPLIRIQPHSRNPK